MEELGGECTSHPLLLTVYRLTGVPNTGRSAIVYTFPFKVPVSLGFYYRPRPATVVHPQQDF